MNITGNTIFIPGSTSGIGLALALRLRKKGNTVIVGGRRTELREQIAASTSTVISGSIPFGPDRFGQVGDPPRV